MPADDASKPDLFSSLMQFWSAGLAKPVAFNFPGSGSIGGFTYQPNTVWEAPSLYRGNISLEQSIYANVASPGKQLGKLTDAVLAIAALLGQDLKDQPAIDELRKISEMIESLKKPVVENAEATARCDLDKLLATNKASLQSLLQEFEQKLKSV